MPIDKSEALDWISVPVGAIVVIGVGGRVIPGGSINPTVLEGVSVTTGSRENTSVLDGTPVIVSMFEIETGPLPLEIDPDAAEESAGDGVVLSTVESVALGLETGGEVVPAIVSEGGMRVSEADGGLITEVAEGEADPVPMSIVCDGDTVLKVTPVPKSMVLLPDGIGNRGGSCVDDIELVVTPVPLNMPLLLFESIGNGGGI